MAKIVGEEGLNVVLVSHRVNNRDSFGCTTYCTVFVLIIRWWY